MTKDNMLRRKWTGDPICRFCESVETTYHLFFQCPTARVVWGVVAHCLGSTTFPTILDSIGGGLSPVYQIFPFHLFLCLVLCISIVKRKLGNVLN